MLASPATFGVVFTTLDESSFTWFLAAIKMFVVWWLVPAMGLSVLYRRPVRPLAVHFAAAYAILSLVIALTGSAA
jgi:hypothetical protein